MEMASKLLMSIKTFPQLRKVGAGAGGRGWRVAGGGSVPPSRRCAMPPLRLARFSFDVFLQLLCRRLVGLSAVALGLDLLFGLVSRAGVRRPHAREVDAELLGGAEQVVVL